MVKCSHASDLREPFSQTKTTSEKPSVISPDTSDGYPAYTTAASWSGYSDEHMRQLCRFALAEGWTRFKLKVGLEPEEDRRRAQIMREEIGPECLLMVRNLGLKARGLQKSSPDCTL